MTEEKTISAFKYLQKEIDKLNQEIFELRDKLERAIDYYVDKLVDLGHNEKESIRTVHRQVHGKDWKEHIDSFWLTAGEQHKTFIDMNNKRPPYYVEMTTEEGEEEYYELASKISDQEKVEYEEGLVDVNRV
jgi:hypothetical protein